MRMKEKELDDRKVAFIICTNDEQELDECFYYLNNLKVPAGYETEVLTVTQAVSMADGYNEAMNASDAKYKVYLHQDVFILHESFLENIITVFEQDAEIGLLGLVGCRNLPKNAYAVTSWDVGRVLHNCIPNSFLGYQHDSCEPVVVDAVDGLLIVTQYDIPWRGDIFDGWDFYDISQCFEFKKCGKKAVVPYQEKAWCYHDNRYSKMLKYHKYRKRFLDEYSDADLVDGGKESKLFAQEYSQMRENVIRLMGDLVDSGKLNEVSTLFDNPDNRGDLAFKEYEVLARIYRAEAAIPQELQLYKPEFGKEEILQRLRELKYLVKRIEFEIGNPEENRKILIQNFSDEAIKEIVCAYITNEQNVLKKVFA